MSSALTVERKDLEAEIEALQKQAQEIQLNLFKIEGALQFAHHLLSKLPPAELPEATAAEGVAPKSGKKK